MQKNALSQDAFEYFDFLKVWTEKDITAMASDFSFSSRTAANGRINFGTMRTKRLKALIHWIQDIYRVSCVTLIVGLSEISFKAELETALTRNEIRKNQREQRQQPRLHPQVYWRAKNNGKNGQKTSLIILDFTQV